LDHFVPVNKAPEGELEYDNLVYACRTCNSAKGQQAIPDPAQELIDEQVIVYSDGRMEGRSDEARRLIRGLALNSADNVRFRRMWIDVIALAERFDSELLKRLMSYPADLPDLSRLRPPGGNSRPEGVERSHFARRERGELAEAY